MTDEAKLDILLREYETLRAEILERLRLAYQQLAWAGVIVAFGIPLAASDFSSPPAIRLSALKIAFAAVGVLILVWLSVLNWTWMRICADQIRRIEVEVNKQGGGLGLLTWEGRVKFLTRGVLRLPKKPDEVTSPVPGLTSDAAPPGASPGT